MTPQDLDAFISREAWQVVRCARLASERQLREARLPPADIDRVLDTFYTADVANYELVVAVLRERLPDMLREAARPTVH